jgi:hypothetical protein
LPDAGASSGIAAGRSVRGGDTFPETEWHGFFGGIPLRE